MKLNKKQRAIIEEKFEKHVQVGKDIIKDWEKSGYIGDLQFETVLWLKRWGVIPSLEKVRDFAELKDNEEVVKISVDLTIFSTSLLLKYNLKLLSAVSLNENNGGGRNNGLYNVFLEGTRENLTGWVIEGLEEIEHPKDFVEDNIMK